LSREEQAKYYEKARQERQLHMQLYPGWSARDNYGYGTKKKKRKKEKTVDGGRASLQKDAIKVMLPKSEQSRLGEGWWRWGARPECLAAGRACALTL